MSTPVRSILNLVGVMKPDQEQGIVSVKASRSKNVIYTAIAGDIAVATSKFIAADSAVESVSHLLTMQLGPESVLLTAAVRFERELNLDEVEQAIERLEASIRSAYPSIQHLFLESGALKSISQSARHAVAHKPL